MPFGPRCWRWRKKIPMSEQDNSPETAPLDRCPDHPTEYPEAGFGLAGGGYGPYMYCPICARILSKAQEREDV